MSGCCAYLALIASFIVAASGPARAVCDGEVSAYESAKASLPADVEAIYHLTLPVADVSFRGHGILVDGWNVNGIDLSDLSEIRVLTRRLHSELDQMVIALGSTVNSFVLKRRTMPRVFFAGADLSRCLAQFERAEFERMSAAAAERAAEVEVSRAEHIASGGGDPEVLQKRAEMEAVIAEVREARDRPEGLAEIEAYNTRLIVLSMELLAFEMANFWEFESRHMADSLAVGVGVAVTVFPNMREREALRNAIAHRFGEELDFGYWEMSEGTE